MIYRIISYDNTVYDIAYAIMSYYHLLALLSQCDAKPGCCLATTQTPDHSWWPDRFMVRFLDVQRLFVVFQEGGDGVDGKGLEKTSAGIPFPVWGASFVTLGLAP